jgi:hypothetical protein
MVMANATLNANDEVMPWLHDFAMQALDGADGFAHHVVASPWDDSDAIAIVSGRHAVLVPSMLCDSDPRNASREEIANVLTWLRHASLNGNSCWISSSAASLRFGTGPVLSSVMRVAVIHAAACPVERQSRTWTVRCTRDGLWRADPERMVTDGPRIPILSDEDDAMLQTLEPQQLVATLASAQSGWTEGLTAKVHVEIAPVFPDEAFRTVAVDEMDSVSAMRILSVLLQP